MKRSNRENGQARDDGKPEAAETTADPRGDDEQLRAFHQALVERSEFPQAAFIIGEPVWVLAFDYTGNPRRGLLARCRREDGSEHLVAASDVVLAPRAPGEPILAAYRKWLGQEPLPEPAVLPAGQRERQKVAPLDFDFSRPIDLIVLSVKERSARCRLPGTGQAITLRASRLWKVVPGEIAVVQPHRQWSYAGHPYLSGEIESARLDLAALDLIPLALSDAGEWDPRDAYWGEEDEPIEEWAKPILARGSRLAFEMEQVVPGRDPDDMDSDPIGDSNDLRRAGDGKAALKILMDLCQADLRCLDAHAHLGNFVFDSQPKDALRHYEVGVRIGVLSLPAGFDGFLLWGLIDNRPFLRCLHGYGLCLWRLGRFEEAGQVFNWMLWLNPTDNQGVRFLIDEVRGKKAWKES